jgi:prophage regulatory protein
MENKLLRIPSVIEATGLSRSSILAMAKSQGSSFPQPLKIGKRAIAWRSQDIQAWIAELPTIEKGDNNAA